MRLSQTMKTPQEQAECSQVERQKHENLGQMCRYNGEWRISHRPERRVRVWILRRATTGAEVERASVQQIAPELPMIMEITDRSIDDPSEVEEEQTKSDQDQASSGRSFDPWVPLKRRQFHSRLGASRFL